MYDAVSFNQPLAHCPVGLLFTLRVHVSPWDRRTWCLHYQPRVVLSGQQMQAARREHRCIAERVSVSAVAVHVSHRLWHLPRFIQQVAHHLSLHALFSQVNLQEKRNNRISPYMLTEEPATAQTNTTAAVHYVFPSNCFPHVLRQCSYRAAHINAKRYCMHESVQKPKQHTQIIHYNVATSLHCFRLRTQTGHVLSRQFDSARLTHCHFTPSVNGQLYILPSVYT
ncbi:hypothetical protein VTK56DRAFT_5681 [Thermocarpiscus australiensis]